MKLTKPLACAAALVGVLAATSVHAQEEPSAASVAIKAGTLGIGPEVGFRPSETFGIRANATFFGVGTEFDSDDVNYDADLDLESYGATVDLYPFGGGFRVSGGLRINNNRASLLAEPQMETIEIGNNEYDRSEVGILSVGADTNDIAPLLTIGYGGGRSRGFQFTIDAGVLFQGDLEVGEINASGGGVAASDLEIERATLQDDVDGYGVYPILEIGVGWRF